MPDSLTDCSILLGARDGEAECFPLVCPGCAAPLEMTGDGARCPACDACYPLQDGILMMDRGGADKPLHIGEKLLDIHEFMNHRLYFERRVRSDVEYVGRLHSLRFHDLHGKWLSPWLANGACIADLGCGQFPYYNSFDWSRISRYYGFDLSLPSLRIAARHLPSGFPVTLIFHDATTTPVVDGSFDAVISSEVLEHVEEPHAYLREIFRILKPGGYVSLSTPCVSQHLYPHSAAMNLLRPWRLGQWWKKLHSDRCWREALSWHPGLRPGVLRRWMERAGFSVIYHRTVLWFYHSPTRPMWRLFEGMERLGVRGAAKGFACYLEGTERLLETKLPGIRWMGIRQFVLARKQEPRKTN